VATFLTTPSQLPPPADHIRYPIELESLHAYRLTPMTSLSLGISGHLPEPELEAVLLRAGFSASVARWVDAHLIDGPYTHYTVSLRHLGSQTMLCIDTFLLETWIHSKTGETGVSPHGSCKEFELDADGNVVDTVETLDDDGSTTHSFSRSVSFYGG
jgi:hypothetical protein